jgi:trimeric autotransporter adhesin
MKTVVSFSCVLFAIFSADTNLLAQSYRMTTVAGSSRLGDGNLATTVPLRYPYGVAQDVAGNIYFADASDNRVRRVGTDGKISTIAGTGVAGFSGDGGPATQAMFDSPQAIRLDAKGANLYVADYNNHRVRVLALASGTVTTLAGNGSVKYSGDIGPAIQIAIDVDDIAIDAAGNLYIADYFNSRIRKVSAANGTISTIAGVANPGNGGDFGPAVQAAINGPTGISIDAQNNVYFVDSNNNRVRKINQGNGIITNFAGTGGFGYGEPDLDGNGGQAVNAFMVIPFSTTVEPNGNVLILCLFELWRVFASDGSIHFIAGSDTLGFAGDGGPAMAAKFAVPIYVAAAPNDNILLADVGNYRVRRIDSSGNVNTVAGTSILDGIPATTAFLNQPDGLLLDGKGGVVIADTGDSRVRSVPSTGIIANLTGSGIRGTDTGELFFPSGITYDSLGSLYIADSANDRVMKQPAGSALMLLAGNGNETFAGDGGQANQASLFNPTGVAVDAAGNVYIADNDNERVRVIGANALISTLAGNGNFMFLGDNAPAKNAQLDPYDVALDNAGNLFVADQFNHRIRKINLTSKVITTVAGIGTPGYSGDGGPATSAQLKFPTSMAVDAAGNLYIADNGNSVVRRVSAATGVINTIAGNGKPVFNVESGTALGVSIDPTRVAVDPTGVIYLTDRFNDRVRKLTVQVPATLSISSGNNQSGPAGTQLPVPLIVKAVDATGTPVGNVPVSFTVLSGTASLSASTATTGGDGQAAIEVTLGATVGPLQIQAASPGLPNLTFTLTITQAVVTTPQPQITSGGVEGAALSVPAVQILSTGGIASVFGMNFGAGAAFQKVGPGDLVNGQVPVNFQSVCVTVGGASAPVFGASNTQVNFQVPTLDSSGSATVQVIAGCGTTSSLSSNTVTIATQPATPEFFYFVQNTSGVNPVAATDAITGVGIASASLFPGSGFAPARPNEYVTVYATGFGATNPAVAPGAFPSQLAPLTAAVTVFLGGVAIPAVNVLYVGVTPGSPGLYQLNLLIPASTPNGDLPLIIQIGSQQSPAGAYLTVQGS